MPVWSNGELDQAQRAEEIELTTLRPDGSERPWVIVWAVRVGDEIYARSARGPEGQWYRHAMAGGNGKMRVHGTEHDVTLVDDRAGAPHAAIDAAYHAKYDRYGPQIVGSVVGSKAAQVTVRIVKR